MSGNEKNVAAEAVFAAVKEWAEARDACIAPGTSVSIEKYKRLARAEGNLRDAVRVLEREG